MVQWRGRQGSGNIEDRRGMSRGMMIGGGGGLATLVVLAIAMLTGVDPSEILQSQPSAQTGQPAGTPPANDEQAQFVSVVLKDTEDTWNQLLPAMGHQYQEPRLTLFSDVVDSACGTASSAVGPFYCSRDSKVYLDMAFFRDLDQRFGAPGDFARAYVVAHEVGHHVQKLLGISDEVQQRQQAAGSREEANAWSVRLELQADCFAGVWANHAQRDRNLLDPGDIDEGLQAASAIGDDRLQQQTRGQVVPESFTHGSSEQRTRWFRTGFEGGDPRRCDTFASGAI